jgi:Phage gp6-like head-tail connector protein
MAYLDVITLERAKTYLRIDADLTEDDDEITSMINAALRFVEKRTNHIMYARDKTYTGNCQVKVWDYPINAVVPATPELFVCHFATFDVWPCEKEITLNVGYLTPDLVPDDLILAALQMIKVWYYESEKQVNTTLIPESVKEVLNLNARFI